MLQARSSEREWAHGLLRGRAGWFMGVSFVLLLLDACSGPSGPRGDQEVAVSETPSKQERAEEAGEPEPTAPGAISTELLQAYESLRRGEEESEVQTAVAELRLIALQEGFTPGDYQLVPRLRALLGDPEVERRRAAAKALGLFVSDYFEAAGSSLTPEEQEPLRRSIDEVIEELLARAEADPDPEVRIAAVEGLAKARTAAAIQPLLPLLEAESRDLRFAALDALRNLVELDREGRIPPAVESLLDDPDPQIRQLAAIVLERAGRSVE